MGSSRAVKRAWLPIIGSRKRWNPSTSLTGLTLVLWMYADDLAGADGDAVASWVSKEGSTRNFAQGTAGYRPVIKAAANGINGHKVVRFDGSDDVLVCSTNFDSSETGAVFYVCRLTDPLQDNQAVFSSCDTTGTKNFLVCKPYRSSTNNHALIHSDVETVTNAVNGNSVISSSTVYLMTFLSNGSSWRIRVNGIAQTLSVLAGSNNGRWFADSSSRDNFVLGGQFDSAVRYPLKGDIMELLYYSGDISDAQIQTVETYLAGRCGITLPPFDFALPNPDLASAANAASALTTPTYDESGQLVHPNVIDAGAGGWNGYRYWMGMTPYPNGNDAYENPSILASANKTTWVLPDGLTNPLANKPETGHNADPALLLDSATLYCYWLEGNPSNVIKCRTSTDGVTWTAAQTVLTGSLNTILSPSVQKIGSTYYMWVVDASSTPRKVTRYQSTSPTGPFTDPADGSGCSSAWHFTVIYDASNEVYYAYATTSVNGLFYVSGDGLAWYPKSAALLKPSAAGWDNTGIYSGCLVRTAAGFDLWYSGNNGTAWYCGYTTVTFTP